MPANTQKRVDIENTYYHIYNKGRENKTLFNDSDDYNTFIGYLNEYLEPRAETPTKKVFTVAGKTFQGVPHLPKNYHKKLELVAYSLIESSFSLIVKQVDKGSLESFIRSLSTRYSIYFNKKYKRTGQLFDGPCKSKHLKSDDEVSLLTYHLHKRGGQSSIDKYLNADLPNWLQNRPDITSYSQLIQNYVPDESQNEIIRSLTFNKVIKTDQKPTSQTIILDHSKQIDQKIIKHVAIHQRVPELVFASALFLTLLVFGLININVSANNQQPTNKPQVAGTATEEVETPAPFIATQLTPTEEKEVIGSITVKQVDPLVPVSIYSDIDKAREVIKAIGGVKLDLVDRDEEWGEVKISDNEYGFIESKYIKEAYLESKL